MKKQFILSGKLLLIKSFFKDHPIYIHHFYECLDQSLNNNNNVFEVILFLYDWN